MGNQEIAGGMSIKMFALGKWLSLIFAFLALLTVIFVAIELLTLGSSFKTPRFDAQAQQTMIGNLPSQQSNVAQQKEQLGLSKDYGSRIISIISKYDIQNVKMNQIITLMQQMPSEYRDNFISGWSEFVHDGIKYAQKNGVYQAQNSTTSNSIFGGTITESTADILTRQYINAFSTAMDAAKINARKDEIKRLSLLGFIVAAVIVFILAMVLPVLVQIEKNTRALARSAPSSPLAASPLRQPMVSAGSAQIHEALCPKCHAPVTPDDIFCGNCGADLR